MPGFARNAAIIRDRQTAMLGTMTTRRNNLKPLVLYHAGCWDGFCAAWVAQKALGDIEAVPVNYGQPPPIDQCGRQVYILDFSYPRSEMDGIIRQSAFVCCLDHHKTAQAALDGLASEIAVGTNGFDNTTASTAASTASVPSIQDMLRLMREMDARKSLQDAMRDVTFEDMRAKGIYIKAERDGLGEFWVIDDRFLKELKDKFPKTPEPSPKCGGVRIVPLSEWHANQ